MNRIKNKAPAAGNSQGRNTKNLKPKYITTAIFFHPALAENPLNTNINGGMDYA